jgi:hypothetical protein
MGNCMSKKVVSIGIPIERKKETWGVPTFPNSISG